MAHKIRQNDGNWRQVRGTFGHRQRHHPIRQAKQRHVYVWKLTHGVMAVPLDAVRAQLLGVGVEGMGESRGEANDRRWRLLLTRCVASVHAACLLRSSRPLFAILPADGWLSPL